ncbi:MAG: hypothetical protein IJR07_06835 [Bacteroidaceae bacterium]|nr:hypothetical protein [Bacteroidaceae bacterium]
MEEDVTIKKKRKRGKRPVPYIEPLPYEHVPAYKKAMDCYKECNVRLKVDACAKAQAREVKEALVTVMVKIVEAKYGLWTSESLTIAVEMAVKVQILLRCMKDIGALDNKSFAFISQHSDNLVRQLAGWCRDYERKIQNGAQIRAPQEESDGGLGMGENAGVTNQPAEVP